MNQGNYPLSRTDNLVTQDVGDDFLIYDLHSDKAFCLNQIASVVWHTCDGTKSVKEISKIVGKTLKSTVDENLIWIALDQLKREKLLQDSSNFHIDFNGLSRREAIKKAGLASLIALPLVTGVIAPTALLAQSGAAACRSNPGDDEFNNGEGCPCLSSDDCCITCGGAAGMMTCSGGVIPNDAAAACFGITCTVLPGQGIMNVINQCPCNSTDDCIPGSNCGGSVNMMICG